MIHSFILLGVLLLSLNNAPKQRLVCLWCLPQPILLWDTRASRRSSWVSGLDHSKCSRSVLSRLLHCHLLARIHITSTSTSASTSTHTSTHTHTDTHTHTHTRTHTTYGLCLYLSLSNIYIYIYICVYVYICATLRWLTDVCGVDVDKRNTPGLQVQKPEDKLGIRASSTCEILFNDVEVSLLFVCSLIF
jgi:hypothetical protein